MRDKILKTVLLLTVASAFSGCDMLTEPGGNSAPEPRVKETKHYLLPKETQSKATNAETAIGDAIQKLKSPSNEVTKDTLTPKLDSAQTASQELAGALDVAMATAPDEIKSKLAEVKSAITESANQIGEAQKALTIKKNPQIAEREHNQISGFLTSAQKQFAPAKTELMKLDGRAYTVNSEASPPGGTGGTITKWLPLAAYTSVAIILVGLVIFGAKRMAKGFWSAVDRRLTGVVNATVDQLKGRQSDLPAKMNSLEASNAEVNSRLQELQLELKSLGRLMRDLTPEQRPVHPDSYRPNLIKATPTFPASVLEYVQDNERGATVVRPDFQKGILVVDPAHESELMLVKDPGVGGEFMMVPRVGQFQTKQDFHTYFGKYYDCQNPTTGDVWILSPATVSTVPGGWQLREKGILEVR